MAIRPLIIDLTTSWTDITNDVLTDFVHSSGVEFYIPYIDSKFVEVIIDTTGAVVIDDTFYNKGIHLDRYKLKITTRLNRDFKYYARALETTASIYIKDEGVNVSINEAGTNKNALQVIAGVGDLTIDAWGRQKVINDVSLFSSAFTFNIDRSLWITYEDGNEIYYDVNITRYSTINGKLNQSSGAIIGQYSYLMSRRHPRYQADRGHLYSSSIFLPNKNAIGIRNFGLFNVQNGAYFSLENGILYAVIRTTINSVTDETFKQAIDLTTLNDKLNKLGYSPINYENGNIYDIQMQWRGVGNIKWFIGDPSQAVSVQVAEYEHLNTSTELSISNPSLPVGYECINIDGTEVIIECGCVDVSTEGGDKGKRTYASFPSGEVAISTAETPIIALRIPNTISGFMNTRDIILSQIDGYADVDTLIRVYYFRDPTAITATFTPDTKGFREISIDGNITAFNPALMEKVFETRIPATDSKQFINPDRNNADFFLVHGDYILATLQGKNNSLGGVTLEYSEEI